MQLFILVQQIQHNVIGCRIYFEYIDDGCGGEQSTLGLNWLKTQMTCY